MTLASHSVASAKPGRKLAAVSARAVDTDAIANETRGDAGLLIGCCMTRLHGADLEIGTLGGSRYFRA
jgi:hypothetical protein